MGLDQAVERPQRHSQGTIPVDLTVPTIVSRRGTDSTEVFPDFATALRDSVPAGTLLDAEVVIYRDSQLRVAASSAG